MAIYHQYQSRVDSPIKAAVVAHCRSFSRRLVNQAFAFGTFDGTYGSFTVRYFTLVPAERKLVTVAV